LWLNAWRWLLKNLKMVGEVSISPTVLKTYKLANVTTIMHMPNEVFLLSFVFLGRPQEYSAGK
jgi:hypothetical protein